MIVELLLLKMENVDLDEMWKADVEKLNEDLSLTVG